MIQVQLIGHVGQNPTRSENNEKVVNFSIAVNLKRGDKQETQWYQVEAWNGLGDTIMEHVSTGKELFVEGPLKVDAYISKEGKAVPSAKITLRNFYFCGKKDNKDAEQQSEVVEMTAKRSRK